MRLAALFALTLAGCSLYFGPDTASPGDDPGPGSQGTPLPPGKPLPPVPSPVPPAPPPLPGGTLPPSCGSPEVHVIGVYETSSNHNTVGDAYVGIERPGNHVLVLSAYEPTNWHVFLAAGATVRSVQLLGYYAQTVDLPNVPVTHGAACGYSYPYNGGGCDTNALLALAAAQAGASVTTFHGCYQATSWKLLADGTATSDCNTAAGYQQYQYFGQCRGSGAWERIDFPTLGTPTCTGARYLRYNDRYGVWVGAILCGASTRYKLYMSATPNDPFLEIADFAGYGQDHCELVNPAFKLPNEDDIQSGGCTSCSLGSLVDIDGPPVYARANFGQPFQRVTSRFWADLTTNAYSCGVSIP